MIGRQHLDHLPGMNVVGSDNENIGKIDAVYVDDATGEPNFALVNTGLFGMRSSFVPLEGADISGDDVVVAYDKDRIKNAPSVDSDEHLDASEEEELYRHYGLQVPTADTTTGTAGTAGTAGTSGTSDDAMTRSEEELHVGTRQRPAGKARLRKHVVTEHVTKTVPVQREEVRVEREPVDERNVDRATDGPAISEDEHEVTLHEEEPVVEKEAVPKERVRLDKETHTDQERVDDDVAKEEIDLTEEESRQDRPRR